MADEIASDFEETLSTTMVKLAAAIADATIEKMLPTVTEIAKDAAKRALNEIMEEKQKLEEDLARKTEELDMLKLELENAKKQCRRNSMQAEGTLLEKQKQISKLEGDIKTLQTSLKKKATELKKANERADSEEAKRIELEQTLNATIKQLKVDLDKVRGQLGRKTSAKNIADKELKELRDRESMLKSKLLGCQNELKEFKAKPRK